MRVRDYYKGKDILITGATGLMGKALVEKLLRSCPEVGNIYVIIRTKKGQDPQHRWTQTTDSVLFNCVKERAPKSLSKVIVLPGESTADHFGLSEEHQKLIVDNVSIVYHVAASISFVENIVSAVKLNLKNTYSILELSKRMNKLEVFVHVSTAYSNFPRTGEIKEEIYDSHLSWRDTLALVEDKNTCDVMLSLQPKLMNGHFTTYTLTKGLAENVVSYYNQYFPIVIVRPSLVSGAFKDPMPGWFDVENFISLFCKGVRMGVLRVIMSNENNEIYHIPLDLATRALIVAPWNRCKNSKEEVEVICCQVEHPDAQSKMTFGLLADTALPTTTTYPAKQALWYPFCIRTRHRFIYYPLVLILHIFPAFLVDLALKCTGQDPMLKKVYSRIWALDKLNQYYFNPHHWFSTSKYKRLEESLLEEDREDFSMNTKGFEPKTFVYDNGMYLLKYVWNEDPKTIKAEAFARMQRLKVAHYTICSAAVIGLSYSFIKLLMLFL